jgi:hypothetical protein
MEAAVRARLGALVAQQAPKFLSKAPVSSFPLYAAASCARNQKASETRQIGHQIADHRGARPHRAPALRRCRQGSFCIVEAHLVVEWDVLKSAQIRIAARVIPADQGRASMAGEMAERTVS